MMHSSLEVKTCTDKILAHVHSHKYDSGHAVIIHLLYFVLYIMLWRENRASQDFTFLDEEIDRQNANR